MSSRILVVDDEEVLRYLLMLSLKEEGYEVDGAEDGEQAINIIQSRPYDLVLLDIKMPIVDGIGVLKFVKEHHPDTEVIMLTAFSDVNVAVECMKLGSSEFLTKPVDPDALSARVRTVLRAQEAERAKQQAIEELERAKADFTAMLVHDLRSPLGGVKGALECIRDLGQGRTLDRPHYDLVQIGVPACEKMLDLINQILDLSKLEAGKLLLSKEKVDFSDIVEYISKSLQIPIKNKKLHLEQKLSSDLPRVDVDPDKIGQVLMNFVNNSIKFTPEGGTISIFADVKETMEGSHKGSGKQLVISVADTGAGISKEEFPLLFEKYKQTMAGKTSKVKGTGLGLVINKRIIEAHGGKVWVESELNKGTSFHFTIPLSTPTMPPGNTRF